MVPVPVLLGAVHDNTCCQLLPDWEPVTVSPVGGLGGMLVETEVVDEGDE